MHEVVIVGYARTPIGDFFGSLKDVTAVDLGVVALKGAIERTGIQPEDIEEVVGGHIYQAGCKGNTARQVALGADCSVETVAATINQQCASSLRAAEILATEMMLGKVGVGAAIGYESMTNVPYLLPQARRGYRMGNAELVDSLLHDALIDAFCGYHMGITAENLAEKYKVSREEQDQYALLSHERAINAMKTGKFTQEIVPVEVKTRKGTMIIAEDEHPNPEMSMEILTSLRPAFQKHGTVTAGNASSLNDGASAIIMMTAEKAKAYNLKPLARIVASASASVAPEVMGIGVVPAVEKALNGANLNVDDIDYWEINEAFAAQFLAVNRELQLDFNKVNANGSGISLGHPVGATGIRLVISLINEMHRRGVQYGCASLCSGGGPAAAMVIEVM